MLHSSTIVLVVVCFFRKTMHHWNSTSSPRRRTIRPPPPYLSPIIQSSLVIDQASPATVGLLVAVCRYVLFMQTTQRLTRVRRLPALRVSDWGFLQGPKGKGGYYRIYNYIILCYINSCETFRLLLTVK